MADKTKKRARLLDAVLRRIQTRRKQLFSRYKTGGSVPEIRAAQEELIGLQLWILERRS